MLFNSLIYLFTFLPIAVIGFYFLGRFTNSLTVNLWLVVCSLFFYSYWLPEYLPLILSSILVNFIIAKLIRAIDLTKLKKTMLVVGCIVNVGFLGYYKYADFFVANVAILFGVDNPSFLNLALPLGISFFTFQQISFLVDSYKYDIPDYKLIDYSLFVSFFPQLIAGPIVHHKEMMPQFAQKSNKNVCWQNIYVGLFFISIGLFKKIAVADTFAVWANEGFAAPEKLDCWLAWRTSLSYTIQLYFDFSGYTDMAIGSARLFNIKLPFNFNSPYISLSIQDFWRRWHMTLSRFLRDYVYIPLGGNKKGDFITCRNLFLTFLIGGLWHGAGWTFVIWGALHGVAVVIHRLWQMTKIVLPKPIAWFMTILFVNFTWVYFRAPDVGVANKIVYTMCAIEMSQLVDVALFIVSDKVNDVNGYLLVLFGFVWCDIFWKNSQVWATGIKPNVKYTGTVSLLALVSSFLLMQENRFSEFLYFQF